MRDTHTSDSSPSYTLSKRHRLLSASDFKPIFDGADIKASHRRLLLLGKCNQHECARLGLVIAKKHAKRAVDRNRLKRLIRESFRLRRENLPPIDVIVLARQGADTLNNADLHAILDTLWTRAQKQYAKR